jgi:hypothetical protein
MEREGTAVADFSATDASLIGFRIVAERPWAVAIWAALQLAVSLTLALLTTSAGPAYARLGAIILQPAPDPATAAQLMAQVAPSYFAQVLLSLAVYSLLFAAMDRAVLRPEERGLAWLRLGVDELRQFGLFALLYGALLICAMLLGVIFALLSPLLLFLIPAAIVGFVFVAVRLSLVSPLAFARGRIDLAGAWAMSRGRFWPIFGAYVIAFALSIVVLVLTLAIAFAAVSVVGGGVDAVGEVMRGDFSSPAALMSPPRLAYIVVISIGQALIWPITLAPPAAIYRALGAPGVASTSRVFE